jgi:hypothetical protein
MDQNWESRNKPLHLWTIDFWHASQNNVMEKEWSFQQILLGLDSHMQKDYLRPLSHTIHQK